MVAGPGSPYRSANAGELSPEAAGRADVKQFYSAGLRFKNVEPVPLSGFRDMGGSRDTGPVRGRVSTLAQTNVVVTAGPHATLATIWQADVAGNVCAIDCAALVASVGTHSCSRGAAEWRVGGAGACDRSRHGGGGRDAGGGTRLGRGGDGRQAQGHAIGCGELHLRHRHRAGGRHRPGRSALCLDEARRGRPLFPVARAPVPRHLQGRMPSLPAAGCPR